MQRIGIVIPSSNVVIEDLLQTGASPRDVRFHVARLPVIDVTLAAVSTEQFTEPGFDAAVRQLCEANVARIVFAGTAGAWLGISRDRDWARRTEAATGRPATTTTLLTLTALTRAKPRRLALITPFTADVHSAIAANLAAEGFPVAGGRHIGLTLSRDMADVPLEEIAGALGDYAGAGFDCVLTFCTNFRGAEAQALVDGGAATLLDSASLTLFAAFTDSLRRLEG